MTGLWYIDMFSSFIFEETVGSFFTFWENLFPNFLLQTNFLPTLSVSTLIHYTVLRAATCWTLLVHISFTSHQTTGFCCPPAWHLVLTTSLFFLLGVFSLSHSERCMSLLESQHMSSPVSTLHAQLGSSQSACHVRLKLRIIGSFSSKSKRKFCSQLSNFSLISQKLVKMLFLVRTRTDIQLPHVWSWFNWFKKRSFLC